MTASANSGAIRSIQAGEVLNEPALAERLGLHPKTLARYRRAGKLPAMRIGRTVLYSWPEVQAALINNCN